MKKYRKKPVVIEAMEFDARYPLRVLGWINDSGGQAWWPQKEGAILRIRTLEGVMTALPGDYVIRGVAGEFYPCKPDIFAATYEEVE